MKKLDLYTLLGVVACIALTLSCTISRSGRNTLTSQQTLPSEQYVVVLSLDGFRYDYQSKTNTPHLDQMDREGLSGTFRPCYPSLTFPNHYSMATGLHPNNHGLVGNEFWDEEGDHYKLGKRSAVENPKFYKGEPLWNTARRAGLRSASFFWVGSETSVGGYQPNIWKRYDSNVPYRDRADSVIKWLQLPDTERPRLIMWYLEEPDHTGHHYSPESQKTEMMIRQVDSVVGYFRQCLSTLPIAKQVNFLLVSDHGMATFEPSKQINLADYLPIEWFDHIATGPFTHLYPKEGYADKALAILQKIPHIKAYRKEQLPKRLHFGSNKRIGSLVVMADLGATIFFQPDPKRVKGLAAGHGFDNQYPEMLALFKAVGPDFEAGAKVQEPVPNITLYPLVCRLLGIQPAEHDADEALAKSLIKRSK